MPLLPGDDRQPERERSSAAWPLAEAGRRAGPAQTPSRAPLTRKESDALAERIEAHFEERGFGLWALDIVGVDSFAGFVGLSTPRFEAPFTPCVEIGWRLAAEHWGHGYATEAARAATEFGFGAAGLREIVSAPGSTRTPAPPRRAAPRRT
ncbi:MAG: GNAT family N-acetyltransferase, partial [Myxococcales bacterium]|nr:GNAT family N-acetyltransferase [Myxococcales bacterium]